MPTVHLAEHTTKFVLRKDILAMWLNHLLSFQPVSGFYEIVIVTSASQAQMKRS